MGPKLGFRESVGFDQVAEQGEELIMKCVRAQGLVTMWAFWKLLLLF